jgi:hypothetical protein
MAAAMSPSRRRRGRNSKRPHKALHSVAETFSHANFTQEMIAINDIASGIQTQRKMPRNEKPQPKRTTIADSKIHAERRMETEFPLMSG